MPTKAVKTRPVHLGNLAGGKTSCGRKIKPWRDDVEYTRMCRVCERHLPPGTIPVFVRGERPFLWSPPPEEDPRPVYGPFLFTLRFTSAHVVQLDQ